MKKGKILSYSDLVVGDSVYVEYSPTVNWLNSASNGVEKVINDEVYVKNLLDSSKRTLLDIKSEIKNGYITVFQILKD